MAQHPTYVVYKQVKARSRHGTELEYVGPNMKKAREVAEEIVEVEKGKGQSEYNAHIQKWSEGELKSHHWGNRQEFRTTSEYSRSRDLFKKKV